MDLYGLKPGDKVKTVDAAVAEVVKATQDGKWILVRYIEGTRDRNLIGTDDLCGAGELSEHLHSG